MIMEYYKYKTIYNYLMSDWTKKYPVFNDVKVYLTNTSDASVFEPSNKYFISAKDFTDYFLNNTKGIKNIAQNDFVMNNNTLKNTELVTDADTSGDVAATGSYEEMFNTPAYKNGQKCPFIAAYKGRARNEARINGEGELTDAEALKNAFSWKSNFDEDEYYRLSIPLTPLNQNTVCFNADNCTVSAKEKFIAKGALVANRIGDNLFPIYFMEFKNPSYYNQYVFNWNPNGVFQVK